MAGVSVGTGSSRIVGRDAELACVRRLVDDARTRLALLLLDGEPGIGKTTVFLEALRLGADAGFTVLSSRPGASDSRLSLAAVADLVHVVDPAGWQSLPPAQSRALDVVAGRAETPARPVEQRTIGAGLRAVVESLASDRPVLVGIDDVQWLDPASGAVLEYALRRLAHSRVAVLLMRRAGEQARIDVDALATADRCFRMRVRPLPVGALGAVLAASLGEIPSRATLNRLHDLSGGNPLFAIELGRMLADRGSGASLVSLPVPEDVQAVVAERVAALPRGTREMLLAAALLARPSLEVLARLRDHSPHHAIAPARRAGIAEIVGSEVRFAHPLHAAAVTAAATPRAREEMHRRLAAVVDGVEERARHAAHVAKEPDAETADLLEEGAEAALRRGGIHAAAELLEQASTLTPVDQIGERQRRVLRTSDLYARVGERVLAAQLLDAVLADEASTAHHAAALRLRAMLHMASNELDAAERVLLSALDAATASHEQIRIKLVLCYLLTLRLDFDGAARWGGEAITELAPDEDPGLYAEALAYAAMNRFLAGRGVDREALRRALELEDSDRLALPGLAASGVVGCVLMYIGDHAEARRIMTMLADRITVSGDDGDLANVLLWRSWLETRSGDYGAAAAAADGAVECALLNRNDAMLRWAKAQRAWLDAHLGNDEVALAGLQEAQSGSGSQIAQVRIWAAATESLLALPAGEHARAWSAARELMEMLEQEGVVEPVTAMYAPEAVEALVGLGELDRAERFLDGWERRARELERVWAIVVGARGRALLLSARGDVAAALAAAHRALAENERLDMPFERARTLLAKGSIHRRARQRSAARAALTDAAAEFDRLGARLWAESARAELKRVEGRRPGPPEQLTAAEARVAALASAGRSNKEIAQTLAVSVHTVEVHLSRAYAKLGIRTRGQLRDRLADIAID